MKNNLLIFCLLAYVHAKTDEDIKLEFTKLVMACTKDHPFEMSELLQLQKLIPPTKTETKCLLACAYKMEGSISQKGLYDVEHAHKVAKELKNGDDKRLINAKKLVDLCSSVNEVAVKDGEKGCERAALLFKCLVENAPKLGFKIL